MNRDDAIACIKNAEPAIRALGAHAVYLFGSTDRNEAKPSSAVQFPEFERPSLGFATYASDAFYDWRVLQQAALVGT